MAADGDIRVTASRLDTRALSEAARAELWRSMRGLGPELSVGEQYDREQRLGRIMRACAIRLRRQLFVEGCGGKPCARTGCSKPATGYLLIWCSEHHPRVAS